MDSAPEQPTDPIKASVTVARREADFAALMDLTRSLTRLEDVFDILSSVVSRLADLLSVDDGSIVLRSAEGGNADSSAPMGIALTRSNDESVRRRTVLLDEYPEIAELFRSARPFVIRDVKESSFLTEIIEPKGSLAFSTLALLPISENKEPVAVLCLTSAAPSAFSDYDMMCAQAVADTTGIALENARARRELRNEAQAVVSAHSRDGKRLKELSQYFSIFENSRDAMLIMDQFGKVLFANPMAERLTGRPIDTLVGLSVMALLDDEERELADELIKGFSNSQYPAGIEFFLKTAPKPTLVCANFSGVLGEDAAVLATLRDVTTERSLGRELAKAREFLERVIESSVDGIVSADLKGNVVVYNRAAARIFGYSPEEVLGKLRTDDLYPQGVARDIMRRIDSEEGGGRGRLEEMRVEMLTKSGDHVPVNLSASWVMDGDRPIGTVGIFTDISEKLAMESSLAAAQRQLQDRQRQDAIAEIAGAAAHELNQPLTSVMGYAEYLKRAVEADPQLGHAVDVILTETQRMADIVRKVGRITRYETKPYVGGAKIVDLDRSSSPEKSTSNNPKK